MVGVCKDLKDLKDLRKTVRNPYSAPGTTFGPRNSHLKVTKTNGHLPPHRMVTCSFYSRKLGRCVFSTSI